MRSSAGAQHEDVPTRERIAEIALDVLCQPDAVEILGMGPFAPEFHCVDGSREPRALGEIGRVCAGVKLEGHGDVEPASSVAAELIHPGCKLPERSLDRDIREILPRRFREHPMDQRRLAVVDRIADDGEEVGHLSRSKDWRES